MTNVFNIEFQYKGLIYPALISLRSTKDEFTVYAQILNEELKNILPEGEIHFRISNNLRKASEPVSSAKMELIKAIRESVQKHLKKSASTPSN
jgi:hypothetical protein